MGKEIRKQDTNRKHLNLHVVLWCTTTTVDVRSPGIAGLLLSGITFVDVSWESYNLACSLIPGIRQIFLQRMEHRAYQSLKTPVRRPAVTTYHLRGSEERLWVEAREPEVALGGGVGTDVDARSPNPLD